LTDLGRGFTARKEREPEGRDRRMAVRVHGWVADLLPDLAEIRTTLQGCHLSPELQAYALSVDDSRSGVLLGVGAYLCWGFFPLYWPLLEPAGSLEILAHRVVWSLLFVMVA